MSQQAKSQKNVDWNKVMAATGPYPLEAYSFVREGLGFTARHVHPNPEALAENERHINGQQLCLGLRDFAIDRYGLMAPIVLAHWNVTRTEDFGRIVFAMIEQGLMSKTPDDSLDDFRGVFDFEEAFSDQELLARMIDD